MAKIIEKVILVATGSIATLLVIALCQKEVTTIVNTTDYELLQRWDEITHAVQLASNWDFSRVDTICMPSGVIYVDSSTPLGQIPPRWLRVNTAIPITVDNDTVRLPVAAGVKFVGQADSFYVRTEKMPYPIILKKRISDEKAIQPFGSIGFGYGNTVLGSGELGVIVKQRVSLSGTVIYADGWHYGGMLRARF